MIDVVELTQRVQQVERELIQVRQALERLSPGVRHVSQQVTLFTASTPMTAAEIDAHWTY